MAKWTEADRRWMQRAIRLSKRGLPAPNPHVGCVVTQADRMVGEGYHRYAGARHAEVEALAAAGSEAAGSTVYVTLEPCNHYGRTPPCTEALIAANVERVVVACLDPNPVASGGIARLRGAGIAVETGLMADEAYAANEQFHVAMRLRRPYVTLKAAISLDGRIALPSGESKWLTSPDARARGRRLRAECGSVLVGRRTVEADDPALTARVSGVVNQPLRVVLDPSAKLDSHWKVFDSSGPSLHLVDGTLGLRAGPMGFDPADLCAALFEQGVTGLLVEGGASTASRFIQTGLVDRIELFLAPKLLGSGPSWVEGLIVDRLADAPLFKIVSLKKLKVDVQISLRAERGNFSRVDTDIAE